MSSDDSGVEEDAMEDDDFLVAQEKGKKGKFKVDLHAPTNIGPQTCGLCGQLHGPNNCPMTEASENLVEYREMLIMHTQDESYEQRVGSCLAPGLSLLISLDSYSVLRSMR